MALTTYNGIIATGGATNVKGDYVQIVASTPYDSSRLYFLPFVTSTAITSYLVDIAYGFAGSEIIIVSDLLLEGDSETILGLFIPIDVDIPAGVRLSARCQHSTSPGLTLNFNLILEDRALRGLINPITYGADTSGSKGVNINPGTTVSTKGAYFQITASTTHRIDALLICAINFVNAALAFDLWQLDIATGAASSETIIIPDLIFQNNVNLDCIRPGVIRVPVSIAAGTRIAVRCLSNVASRIISIVLIGMQETVSDVTTHGRITQDVIEVLNQPFPDLRMGQYLVEVLSDATFVAPVVTESTQFYIVMP